MTTIQIDETTKVGKLVLELAQLLSEIDDGIKIIPEKAGVD